MGAGGDTIKEVQHARRKAVVSQFGFEALKWTARLTNGFSKKIENHAAMVAIHFMYYNFARIHKRLRVTPAMAAGIADHVWSLEEIFLLAA